MKHSTAPPGAQMIVQRPWLLMRNDGLCWAHCDGIWHICLIEAPCNHVAVPWPLVGLTRTWQQHRRTVYSALATRGSYKDLIKHRRRTTTYSIKRLAQFPMALELALQYAFRGAGQLCTLLGGCPWLWGRGRHSRRAHSPSHDQDFPSTGPRVGSLASQDAP